MRGTVVLIIFVSLSCNCIDTNKNTSMIQRFSAFCKRGVLLSALMFPAVVASAQTQTEKFVPGATVEGVSYFLPRTALRMIVTVEKSVTTPGDAHAYAYKYMRLQDVPTHASTTWRVTDIRLIPYGIPDKDKAYSIKLKGRTVAPLVSLSREGLLLGINTKGVAEASLPAIPQPRVIEKAVGRAEVNGYLNRDMLQAGSTAKMAELVAREIYDIRESRDALLRGEADNTPKDGQQLKLMLEGLDRQQRALGSLFAGTTEVTEMRYALDVVPAEETDKLLLFRFSKWSGLVDADDMSGAPFYISIRSNGELPERSADPAVDAKKNKLQRAVYYNVPARTTVRVFDAEKTYTETEVHIAQFGYEEILSNVLFDKMPETRVTFHQSTGGIKEINAEMGK